MSELVNSRILGLGHHVPERVVTNADLTRLMDTSEEWIQQRTGIQERRFISEDRGPAELALPAAQEALRAADVKAEDLDLILFGTLSPDVDSPSSASLLLNLEAVFTSLIAWLLFREHVSLRILHPVCAETADPGSG